jgi:hypothetical protein
MKLLVHDAIVLRYNNIWTTTNEMNQVTNVLGIDIPYISKITWLETKNS